MLFDSKEIKEITYLAVKEGFMEEVTVALNWVMLHNVFIGR